MSKNNRYCPVRGEYGKKAELFFLKFAKNIFKEGILDHHPDGKLNVDFKLTFPDNSFFQFEVEISKFEGACNVIPERGT